MMGGLLKSVSCSVVILHVIFAATVAGQDSPDSDFSLTRVRSEELEDHFRVRVEFDAPTKPSEVLLRSGVQGGAEPLYVEENGVVDFRVPKNDPSRHFGDLLHFIFPWQFVALTLKLNGTIDTTVDLPRVTVHVTQGRDVTFKDPRDVELDVTWKVEGVTPDAIMDESLYYTVMTRNENEPHTVDQFSGRVWRDGMENQHLPLWFELEEHGGGKGDRWGRFRLNSTRQDPRGVVLVIGSVDLSRSSRYPVGSVHVGQTVALFSEQHSGPFPPGFLGFVRDEHVGDQSRVYCDTRPQAGGDYQPCSLSCQTVGSEASTTQILKMNSYGDVMVITDLMMSDGAYWSASEVRVYGDMGTDTANYVCIARSASSEIRKVISVVFYESPEFDRDASYVTKMDNGSIAATCVAESNPAPNVTFSADTWPLSDDPLSYDVTMTKESETRTRADIVVTDPDVASNVYSFECRAENVGETEGDRYGRFSRFHYMYVDEQLGSNLTYIP